MLHWKNWVGCFDGLIALGYVGLLVVCIFAVTYWECYTKRSLNTQVNALRLPHARQALSDSGQLAPDEVINRLVSRVGRVKHYGNGNRQSSLIFRCLLSRMLVDDVKPAVGGKCKAGQKHTCFYRLFISSCIHTTISHRTSPRFRRVMQARVDLSCSILLTYGIER